MGSGNGWFRKTISLGWKLALVAAVGGFIVYQMHFAPVSVQSQVAATGSIQSEVLGTGTLEARIQATVSAKISGRIAQVLADQGDRVTKGQLLATLDDGDLRQQVEMARAELAATKAGVDRAAADVARAEASAVFARAEIKRIREMHEQNAVSDSERDRGVERLGIAEAELERARVAKVEMERQVVKSEESLRFYQERLADTKIESPFDGLITLRSREPGDIVVPGGAIMQVISMEEMWVSAWVDESAISSLAVGQPARVVFRSEPGRSYAGAVTRLAPLADRETREFLVDVTVKDLPKTWAVGQRSEVYIQTAKKDSALLAPRQAVAWSAGPPGLFVSDGGRARWRSVRLGLRGLDKVEVIEGLAVGETVIWPSDAQGRLTDGRAVRAR